MTNLSSFSVINQRVLKIKADADLESSGIAFDRLALQIILKLNEEEIEDAITDGSMDGGIDAIHIADRDVHIFNFKYTEDFEKTSNHFPEEEINKIVLTVQQIYGASLDKNTVNESVWDKYQEIIALFQSGPLNFKIYLASNKLKPIEHAQRKLETSLEKYRYISFVYYELEDFVSRLLESRVGKVNGKLTFQGFQHFEKSDGPIKTVIGVVSATDIIDLIRDQENPNLVNENVFDENVRLYKSKHRVNVDIIDSAISDTNYEFFYLNNGITILCEGCGYMPNTKNPVVPLTNIQIINGGQTSHSLFESYKLNPERVKRIEVLVRVCVAKKGDPISEKISETSNNQIPVGTRDLHANDKIQRKLREEFRTLGYYYESKPNQFIDEPSTHRLNNELLGQIYLAYELDMPSEAKNNKTMVFGERYDDIFNPEKISALTLLRLYKIYLPVLEMKKTIQSKKRKKEEINERESFVSRATFHILNTVKLVIQNKMSIINENYKTKTEIEQATKQLYSNEISSIIAQSIDYIGEVVTKEAKIRGELYTHDKFFKEVQTNKIIRDHVLNKLRLSH